MANIVVIGAQWGDEGKGKIVDILTTHSDVVARYQGGHNAGHTVVIGDEQFILHLVPSGILHKDKACVIGNGVVIDPKALIDELDGIEKRGISVGGRLFISDNAHLIMPYHVILDQGSERAKGSEKIGTTGRGIGPCYVDKMGRCGIRAGDLLRPGTFRAKLEKNLKAVNITLQNHYGIDPLDADAIYSDYMGHAERLAPFVTDTAGMLNAKIAGGRNILIEGAQGTLLDIDHGTYPFVTSSSPAAGGACTGLGIGPTRISGVLGIIKAYTTRVGEGPFPTELNDRTGEFLRATGGEYGATTGRPRRCGWFDAVIGRYSADINGFTGLALTKLDVLDDLDEILICTKYRVKGTEIASFPHDSAVLEAVEPVYESFPGWKESTVGATDFNALPKNARDYIKVIEDMVGVPVDMISTGQKRNEIIVRRNPFEAYKR
ncbi:MAG: adenylosuccinate synthase [Nitrospirae bacterium]|nr:adenylosuccinate synthase [Nitrospirota bacterium]